MDYYGPEDMRAQYFANMGLAPDGASPLRPPVPTAAAFAADPASSFGAPAAGMAGGIPPQSQAMMGNGVSTFGPQGDAPTQYGQQQGGGSAVAPRQAQQEDNSQRAEQYRQSAMQRMRGHIPEWAAGMAPQASAPMVPSAGAGAAGDVSYAEGPRPDFGGGGGGRQARGQQIQERQMYGDRDRYDPQAVQNIALTQPSSAPPQYDNSRASIQPQYDKGHASVQPQSQRPSPQPFRPMGPKQSPARGPMSASSTMGGNPQNTRPRQPNPAMPPPGQPMRGPRRSTPMGS